MKKLFITALALVTLGTTIVNAKPVKKQHLQAVASFTTDFIGAENVQWNSDADFIYASFKQNDEQVTAVYEKETSAYVGYLKNSDADHLPSTIRQLVKENFEGFTAVGSVAEVSNQDKNVYFLTLENTKQVLKVKMDTDGSIKIISRLKKS